MQSLGGSHTVMTDQGYMVRVDAKDADALGFAASTGASAEAAPAEFSEQLVWELLRTVYDPEIPVNVVDLGLIYECKISPVEGGNRIKIHRIVGATDPGTAVNPAQIERQMSGSFVYGLSALFYGEISIKDGAVEQKNFDTYNTLRMREMPQVETILMPSGGFWAGIGEPTISVAAPAVLNAYFAASGKRIRSFPLKNQGIQTA